MNTGSMFQQSFAKAQALMGSAQRHVGVASRLVETFEKDFRLTCGVQAPEFERFVVPATANVGEVQASQVLRRKVQAFRFQRRLAAQAATQARRNAFQLFFALMHCFVACLFSMFIKAERERRERVKVERVSKPKFFMPPDLSQFQQQSNTEDVSVSRQVQAFLKTLIPQDLHATAIALSILTSLTSLILAVIQFSKNKGKLSIMILVSTISNFIINILIACKLDTEFISAMQTFLLENPLALITKPAFDVSQYSEPGDEEFDDELAEPEKLFIEKLFDRGDISKEAIVKLHLQHQTITLPSSQPPVATTNSVRSQLHDLRFPSWFLRSFWFPSYVTVAKMMERDPTFKPTWTRDYVRRFKTIARMISPTQCASDDEIEEKIVQETVEKEILTKESLTPPNLENFEQQIEVSMTLLLRKFFQKLLCLLIFSYEAITSKKPFKASDLIKSLRMSEDIEKESSDLQEIFALATGKETPLEQFNKTMDEYRSKFDKFLETPSYVLARNPVLIFEMKSLLVSFNTISLTVDRRKFDISSMNHLATAVSTRIHKYLQNDIQCWARQEPFVVCFQGSPANGKTFMAKKLAMEICKDLGLDYKTQYVEVSPEDKYWPPFAGQSVALFDDCGSSKDFEKDLLFKNMKNICSPSMFNAAAADLDHKINPINFRVILATTNTDFHEIASRVSSMYDAVSAEAYMRRMMCIKTTWNEAKCGKLNVDDPSQNNYKPNFEHLKLSLGTYDKGNFKYNITLSYEQLKQRVKEREHHHSVTFTRWLQMAGMEQQSDNARTHYSIAMHGRAGQGKTTAAKRVMNALSAATRYPTYVFSEFKELIKVKFPSRSIVLLDDIYRSGITLEEENVLMDLYNSRLPDGSILISTTNVSPEVVVPTFTGTALVAQRNLQLKNEGLIRRLGFQQFFRGVQQPLNGMELRVNNMRYYSIVSSKVISLQMWAQRRVMWISIGISTLVHCFLTYVPFIHLIILYFYLRVEEKEIHFDKIPEEIFESYKQFCISRNSVQVEYVSMLNTRSDYHLVIDCKHSSSFMRVSGVSQADKHVFFEMDEFFASQKDWKIYMHSDIMCEIQKNIERYVLNSFSFSEESVIALIERYIVAFRAAGIKPLLYAKFGDLGEYEYADGVLRILSIRSNLDEIENTPVIIFDDTEWVVYFRNRVYKFNEIINLDFSRIISEKLCYRDAQRLITFANSQTLKNNIYFQKFVREKAYRDIQERIAIQVKKRKDQYLSFIKHPVGIVCSILFAVIMSIGLFKLLKKLLGKNDRDREWDEYYWDQWDDQGRMRRKFVRKTNNYNSDLDEKQQQRKKNTKGLLKRRNAYDSDADKHQPQFKPEDIQNLRDMNSFRALHPYFNAAYDKVRKNLCQLYISNSKEQTDLTEPEAQVCYGLFIKNNMFVTIGHVSADDKNKLWVGKDEWNGKFHKATFVCKPLNRDISVWKVDGINNEKDLTSFFMHDGSYEENLEWNAVLSRWGPGKKEEFHTSQFHFWNGPHTMPLQPPIAKYGEANYASTGICMTTNGDCGLPYYVAERDPKLSNKILGIHCMGNIEGYRTSGIVAIITQEDILAWTQIMEQQAVRSCCKIVYSGIMDDDNPKCPGHKTVWNKVHQSNWATFHEEYQEFIKMHPNFVGGIIKNSGTLQGSVEHSHTQFLPFANDVVDTDVSSWKNSVLSIPERGDFNISTITVEIESGNLFNYLKKYQQYGQNFRVRAYRYKPKNITVNSDFKLRLQISVIALNEVQLKQEINTYFQQKDTLIPFESKFGSPVYVTPAVHDMLQGSLNNLERGKLEDVPFCDVDNNHTVKVIGSFCQNKSHVPKDHYKLSPFSSLVKHLIPMDKIPCVFDMSRVPQEEKDKMVVNRYGQPCQRATLSLAWAHASYGCRSELREVNKEFIIKIKSFYSGVRCLTDEEVLGGIREGSYTQHIGGMELDKSVGFTMKELFYVTKKVDIISVDDKGKYSWNKNPAAEFLQQQYQIAKGLSDKGLKYFSAFQELLKMEKLKVEGGKCYRGRTFVAQDMLGVLMERRNLGMICAKAYKDDPECGIGIDPHKNFHQLFVRLRRHPNLWAGDYKNFDRNTPASVQYAITDMLCEVNPKVEKQIRSSMSVNIERIQVSGTTLFEVLGGMPSGCFATAPLNSLNNEYLMYSCFHFLCLENGLEPTWLLYNTNIERVYYGDDVIVSVSDLFKDIFTRKNVSKILKDYFGMTLDSSAKDGSESTFDTFETASWISRFFKKLIKYDIYVGALKKASIHANFHYVSSLDYSHLGSLMERAQWEAAMWEPEYFDKIQQAILLCIAKHPPLLRFVQPYQQSVIQQQVYETAARFAYPYEKQIIQTTSWADEVEEELGPATPGPRKLNFFAQFLFPSKYIKNIRKMCQQGITEKDIVKSTGSYSTKLNTVYQERKITKPKYTFQSSGPAEMLTWTCTLMFTVLSDGIHQTFKGYGSKKIEAQEYCAYVALDSMHLTKTLQIKTNLRPPNLQNFRQEINKAPDMSSMIPNAPMTNTDVSVVADAGLFTNTNFPAPDRIFNQGAFSLDNPSGTGAPFSKAESVYGQYHRWEEKDTNITPAMTKGSRVLTLSLDPSTLPKFIREYVDFHEAYLPSIDVGVVIAGAAGTIGWVTIGWVPDASKKDITLQDLSMVASETMNLNSTIVFKTTINDVRQAELFRVRDRPSNEPYPGLVMLIEHPITNVNRNDAVNYPVIVSVRLGQCCALMRPFRSPSSVPPSQSFNLGSYFYDDAVDGLVGASAVVDDIKESEIAVYPDNGWLLDDFKPGVPTQAMCISSFREGATSTKYIMIMTKDATISPTHLDQAKQILASGKAKFNTANYYPPKSLVFSYGKVQKIKSIDWQTSIPLKGSVYKTEEIYFYVGPFRYVLENLVVQPLGCYVVYVMDSQKAALDDGFAIFAQNCRFKYETSKENLQDDLDTVYHATGASKTVRIDILYPETIHNDDMVGDTFDWYIPQTLETFCDFKRNQYRDISLSSNPKVFIMTGNSLSATPLPTGLQEFSFVRSGSTAKISTTTPFVPLYKPIIQNAYKALNLIAQELGAKMVKADLYVRDKNLGQIGYTDGVFFIRSSISYRIYPNIGDNVFLKNITELSNEQGLEIFDVTAFIPWSQTLVSRPRVDFSHYRQEMMAAAGVVQGLGQGLMAWQKQQFEQQMLEKVLRNNEALQGANNAAIAQRQKDAFQRNLELTGYSSPSAQFGLIGPREKQHMNTEPYKRLDDSFAKAGTQIIDTSGTVGFSKDGTFSRVPPPSSLIEKQQQPNVSKSVLSPDAPEFNPASLNLTQPKWGNNSGKFDLKPKEEIEMQDLSRKPEELKPSSLNSNGEQHSSNEGIEMQTFNRALSKSTGPNINNHDSAV